MAWSVNTLYYLALKEVHSLFLEFFLVSAAEIVREVLTIVILLRLLDKMKKL